MSLSTLRCIVKDREACTLPTKWSQRIRRDLVTEHQQIYLFNSYDYCGLHIHKILELETIEVIIR